MVHPFEQRLEVGPWFDVGRRLDGAGANLLLSEGYKAKHHGSAYCVYIHVPFCLSRCGYCALYTHAVLKNQGRVFDAYLAFIKMAIRVHPCYHPAQPPTTVHFGGGTPLSLGLHRFSELVTALREGFGDSPACEWAVETTTSSIDTNTITTLQDLRVTRVHLGIQTLDDDIRRRIKRRESGEVALEKIRNLHRCGFLTSADLIIGFDQQTEQILADDLDKLYTAGVRMFSICELRTLNIERRDAGQMMRMERQNYRFWQLIWEFMAQRELIPIHIGQFGRSQADNLYFTHPVRDEDCVAMGPYSHGTRGSMYYANKLTPGYYRALRNGASPIEFAVVYDEPTQRIRALESQLLTHRVCRTTVDELLAIHGKAFGGLMDFWLDEHLLLASREGESFVCSCDGSWFVGNMIHQVRQMAMQHAVGETKPDPWQTASDRMNVVAVGAEL